MATKTTSTITTRRTRISLTQEDVEAILRKHCTDEMPKANISIQFEFGDGFMRGVEIVAEEVSWS